MINFAIIGTNFISDRFLEAASECVDMKFTAVYSRARETGEAFGRKYGVEKVFTSLDELAADEGIDAVYIASPNSLHCKQAELMLSRGKHVLCEKTIASNSRELDKMIKTAEDNNAVLIEAMRPVFDPGFKNIQDNLIKLGKIRSVYFEYCQYSSRYDNFKRGIIENAFRPELSNGALMDIGVYCIHPMAALFGAPKSVTSSALKLENGVDGAGSAAAVYDGMLAIVQYSKIAQGYLPSQIQGENGTMLISRITDPDMITINYRNGESEVIRREERANNMLYEALAFQKLINEGGDWKRYVQNSKIALGIMDDIRKQNSIVFEADKIN